MLHNFLLFSHSVMSDCLLPYGLQYAKLPCASPPPGACSNSCPLSWWCHPTIPSSVTPSRALNLSQDQVFSNELVFHIRWPKYWHFNFSISPSKEYSELISFRINWFYLLAAQGTLKSLLQYHNLKASVLWCSVFMVQLSHLYTTMGKTIALTVWNFVGKVMSLLFNMLSRFVIAFLPRSQRLWISRLQPLSAVILEPKKIKPVTVSIFYPFTCHEVMRPDAMNVEFWAGIFTPLFYFHQEAL